MADSAVKPLQFRLGSLFALTTFFAIAVASWFWFGWELRVVFHVPLLVAGCIFGLVFVQTAILWLTMLISARLARFFRDH